MDEAFRIYLPGSLRSKGKRLSHCKHETKESLRYLCGRKECVRIHLYVVDLNFAYPLPCYRVPVSIIFHVPPNNHRCGSRGLGLHERRVAKKCIAIIPACFVPHGKRSVTPFLSVCTFYFYLFYFKTYPFFSFSERFLYRVDRIVC